MMNKNAQIKLEYGEQALLVARFLNVFDAKLTSDLAINVKWTGSDADWDTDAWRLKSAWAIYVTGEIAGIGCRVRVYFVPDPAAPGRFKVKRFAIDGGPRGMNYREGEFPD